MCLHRAPSLELESPGHFQAMRFLGRSEISSTLQAAWQVALVGCGVGFQAEVIPAVPAARLPPGG